MRRMQILNIAVASNKPLFRSESLLNNLWSLYYETWQVETENQIAKHFRRELSLLSPEDLLFSVFSYV